MPDNTADMQVEPAVIDYSNYLSQLQTSVDSISSQLEKLNQLFDPETSPYVPDDYTASFEVLNQHFTASEGFLKIISESNPQFADFTSQFTEISSLLKMSNKADEDLQYLNLVSVSVSICIAFLVAFLLGFYIASHFFKRM